MSASLYLRLTDYNGKALTTTGQYDGPATVNGTVDPNSTQFLKINSYSNDVVQTLNIGSQSTGAGAGKIIFNPLAVSRMADGASPILFQAAASGTPFKTAELFVVNQTNAILFKYLFKLVAVKSVAWASSGDEGVMEVVSFEFGALLLTANQQNPDGKMNPGTTYGWNRIKNIKDTDATTAIS